MVDWEDFYSAFRAPDFIPGYEIQNHLGGGAFGEVYKARKSSIGKPYAVKFLRLDEGSNQSAIERELEHVRLFAAIDHPNLVTIEDMGVVKGVPYLIMGYAGEETLARRIKRGDLESESALRYFVQACRGVLALHDRRLAHFDLKPSNVFLKGDVARVGDYGLAKLLVEGRQTLSMGRGTPHYMAPEMFKNRADHRADIYSLGVILFESLTSKLPFEPQGAAGLVLRESDDPPAFPAGFPDDVRAVVERALRLDPDVRYGSVHDLLADLGQTSRQGDSVRVRAFAAPTGTPRMPSAAAAPPPTEVAPSGELRQAAAELARGAASVARGVWQGVRERVTSGESPRAPARAPETRATQVVSDVVSLQTLDPTETEPLEERALAGELAPVLPALPKAALLPRAPYGPGPEGGTVPVPPRADGGVIGTLAAAAVLGAEILGAVVTGPLLYTARGVGSLADRWLRGVPAAFGGLLRTGLYFLALALFGALSALVVLSAIALSS